jgi:hypothetical protein
VVVARAHGLALTAARKLPARSNRDDHRARLEADAFEDETTDTEKTTE